MDFLSVFVAFILACGIQVVTGEYCGVTAEYCNNGCCGFECCLDNDGKKVAIITGSIVGGLIFLNIIIAIICICVKHTCRPKSAIQPSRATAVNTRHQQVHGHMQQKNPAAQHAPGQFGNPTFPQQQYPPIQSTSGQFGNSAYPSQQYPPIQSAGQFGNSAYQPQQYPLVQPVPGQFGNPAFPLLQQQFPPVPPPPYPGQTENKHPPNAPPPAQY